MIEFYFNLDLNDDAHCRLRLPHGLDARAELRALRAQNRGFKFAHKLITQDLNDSATLLFYICQPCYTRHCELARDILSPKHNVLHLLKMSKGEWQKEIQEVADAAFRSHGNLSRFGLLEMQRYSLEQQEQI